MSIKEDILDMVQKKRAGGWWDVSAELRDIIKAKDFYLTYGVEAYNNFMGYDVNKKELKELSEEIQSRNINEPDEIRKMLSGGQYSFNGGKLLHLLDTLIVYLDKSGKNRLELNKYTPRKRNVSRAMVRPHDWYKQLIRHKLNVKDDLSPNVFNSLNYILNPKENISIVSGEARVKVAQNIFGSEYENKTIVKKIKEMFADHKDVLGNQINHTIFCSRLLYEKDIEKIWNVEKR